MPARTHDGQDGQQVICYRRADYVLRLVLHGLRVYCTGVLFYPLCGTGYVPVITLHPPVWWASEARRGFQLLDSARQADALGPA
ncbi:MAG TPA: hypothetical protein VMI73_20995 [Trebonia sp.]|nr:hypothetical protein [Trebonia sp.]